MTAKFESFLPQLVDAVATRKSRRKILPCPLTEGDEQKLHEFLEILPRPFEHSVDISLHEVPEKSSVYLFSSSIKTIAAFVAPTSIMDQAKIGFLGELFILFCESLGVATCWLGHYRRKNVYQLVYGT